MKNCLDKVGQFRGWDHPAYATTQCLHSHPVDKTSSRPGQNLKLLSCLRVGPPSLRYNSMFALTSGGQNQLPPGSKSQIAILLEGGTTQLTLQLNFCTHIRWTKPADTGNSSEQFWCRKLRYEISYFNLNTLKSYLQRFRLIVRFHKKG